MRPGVCNIEDNSKNTPVSSCHIRATTNGTAGGNYSASCNRPVTDPRHSIGGRRMRKVTPVDLPPLPALRRLAFDQSENLASEG